MVVHLKFKEIWSMYVPQAQTVIITINHMLPA